MNRKSVVRRTVVRRGRQLRIAVHGLTGREPQRKKRKEIKICVQAFTRAVW